MPKRLILASSSPRRKELLAQLGVPFEVIPSQVMEEETQNLPPPNLALTLARVKALEVWHRHPEKKDILVLGADTIVVTNQFGTPTVLNKPDNAEEARRMLQMLSGSMHSVYTGLALVREDSANYAAEVLSEVVETRVVFRELPPVLIEAYIATGEPFDKAGAYGIQGRAAAFVEAIYGDYFNVVGLPVQAVARLLEIWGIEWWRGAEALG
jgi:septum formation protein